MTPRLQVDNLVVRFAGLLAVNGLSLTLAPGEIRGLIGPNGAGKTTVINAITGTVATAAGSIALDGQNISNRPTHQISRLGIGRTFQHVEPFSDMSVLDNVLVGVARHIPLGIAAAALATPAARSAERAAREAAHAILKRFELWPFRNERAADLPFGLLKRMDLARALAARPTLLLMDEPTSGMSAAEADSAIAAAREVAQAQNITLLVIEHNMRVMMALADSVTVMQQGAVIAQGTPGEVQSDPAVIDAYLGDGASDAAH